MHPNQVLMSSLFYFSIGFPIILTHLVHDPSQFRTEAYPRRYFNTNHVCEDRSPIRQQQITFLSGVTPFSMYNFFKSPSSLNVPSLVLSNSLLTSEKYALIPSFGGLHDNLNSQGAELIWNTLFLLPPIFSIHLSLSLISCGHNNRKPRRQRQQTSY